MLLTIWEFAINFIELCLFFLYCDSLFHWKKKYQQIHIAPVFYLFLKFLLMILFYFIRHFSAAAYFVFLIGNVLFIFIFFSGVWYLHLFYGILYLAICLLSKYLVWMVSQVLLPVPLPELIIANSILIIPIKALSILFITIVVFFIHSHKKLKLHFRFSECLLYILIAFAGTTAVQIFLCATILISKYATSELTSVLAIFTTTFLISFLILLFYSFRLSQSKQENLTLIRKNAVLALEEIEYQNLAEMTQSLRMLKHDMNHHFEVMQRLADGKNYEELVSYLSDYSTEMSQFHHFPSTGNSILDCLLTAKIQKGKSHGIKITYTAYIPDTFHMDSISFTALLGNMFDNALDACVHLKQITCSLIPEINFSIRPYQKMLIIHMENPSTGEYQYDSQKHLLSTNKKNNLLHGLGLTRMQQIVEKADGTLSFSPLEDRFIVHILLPLSES